MREIRVRALGWEDSLEKEMAIHSSPLAWRIPWTEEPGRLQSVGSQRVGHSWATSLHSSSALRFCFLQVLTKSRCCPSFICVIAVLGGECLVVLICFSPYNQMMLSIFRCVYWPVEYLLWRGVFSHPLPVFWIALSFYCQVLRVPFVFWMLDSYQIHNMQIFSPILWVVFFLIVAFKHQSRNSDGLPLFLLLLLLLVLHCRLLCRMWGHADFLRCLSSYI